MNSVLQTSSFLPLLFVAVLFTILFLQSGLDKVFDFKSNLKFLTTHFSSTIFKNQVKPLLITLIVLECVTGLMFFFSLIGFLFFSFYTVMKLLFFALIMANITLCCLFLGQRIAKEYVGSANLVLYFLVAFLSFLFF